MTHKRRPPLRHYHTAFECLSRIADLRVTGPQHSYTLISRGFPHSASAILLLSQHGRVDMFYFFMLNSSECTTHSFDAAALSVITAWLICQTYSFHVIRKIHIFFFLLLIIFNSRILKLTKSFTSFPKPVEHKSIAIAIFGWSYLFYLYSPAMEIIRLKINYGKCDFFN